MNDRELRRLLAKVELAYEECWTILVALREEPSADLPRFQPLLADTLADLSTAYQGVQHRRNQLIERKSAFAPEWFRRRQSQLARIQKLITYAIGVGKSLGDAFAWFFYQRTPELLHEHRSSQCHIPTGIGGRGERAFVRGVQSIDKYFVLYHNTTSFLSLGDVSLVDLDTLRVEAIAELKSAQCANDQLHVLAVLLGNISQADLKMPDAAADRASPELSAQQRDRLHRQMLKISESLKKAAADRPRIQLEFSTGRSVLQNAYRKSAKRQVVFSGVSASLAVGIYRQPSKSLYACVSTPPQIEFESASMQLELSKLVLPKSDRNALWINMLQYTPEGMPNRTRGTMPLFWWCPDLELAHDVIFQRAVIVTVYNPAHLQASIVQRGFSIDESQDRIDPPAKNGRDFSVCFVGVSCLHDMIRTQLVSEESVVECVSLMLRDASPRGEGRREFHKMQFWEALPFIEQWGRIPPSSPL